MQLSKAFTIIIGSTLLVSGSAFTLTKAYKRKLHRRLSNPDYRISLIVQTGPEKNALPTQYLAQLLDLSVDEPCNLYAFSTAEATQKLLASPLIKSATLRPIKPSALYIDYTVRRPIARLASFENTGVDRDGYLFPLEPLLTPQSLPEMRLAHLPDEPWGKRIDISQALKIYDLITQESLRHQFELQALDISDVDAPSAGRRQIVIRLLDEDHPRVLRLSTTHPEQDLGNYLNLRKNLSADEQVIDFRLSDTAFISR